MRVISYNCQNFKGRNRRELVMCKLNADYVGIQGTRMEADRSAEVVKEKIGNFHLYHFGYKGAKANDRNTHAGLTMCFKEDPMTFWRCLCRMMILTLLEGARPFASEERTQMGQANMTTHTSTSTSPAWTTPKELGKS